MLIESTEDEWLETGKTALTILEKTFSPDDIIFDNANIWQLLKKIYQMTVDYLTYDVRRIEEIALVKIRDK